MKKFLVIAMILGVTTTHIAFSQTNNYNTQKKVYKNALKYGDYAVARTALFNMMVIKPEVKELKDTLAMIYFQQRAFVECITVSTEILNEFPDKLQILNLKAVSEEYLGLKKEALIDYEKLFLGTKKVTHLYQIATLQFDLQRVLELNQTIAIIKKHPETSKEIVNMVLKDGSTQDVPLLAAVDNIEGVVALNAKNFEQAKKKFEDALELKSDFEQAVINLKVVTAKLTSQNEETAVSNDATQEKEIEDKDNKKKKKKKK